MIENISANVIKGGVYCSDVPRMTFEQFVISAPQYSQFGEDMITTLLLDACNSLFMYAKKYNRIEDFDIRYMNGIVEKYAHIWYHCEDSNTKDGVMQLLRCAIHDACKGYDINSTKSDTLSSNLYSTIRQLIECTVRK